MPISRRASVHAAIAILIVLAPRLAGAQGAEMTGDYRTERGENISVLKVELGLAFFHFGTGRFGILHSDPARSQIWFAGPGANGASPKEIEIEFIAPASASSGLIYRDLLNHRTEAAKREPDYRKRDAKISYDNITLNASLSFPQARGPCPAIVLVHGGGPGPRSALQVWSNMYNRLGLACLTYDKREAGSGYSAGPYWRSFEDLAQDAMACIDFLRNDREIDKEKIGLAAFSQGGWASAIAASRTKGLSFMIMVSCPVTSPAQRDHESAALRLLADGFSQEDISQAMDFGRAYDMYGKGLMSWTDYAGKMAEGKKRSWFPYVEYEPSPIGPEDAFYRSEFGRYYEPKADLSTLKIPILAIYGQNDKTVNPLTNSQKAMEYLRAGSDKTVIVVIPKANHGLVYSETGSDKELANLNTYVLGYLELIKMWLEEIL